MNEAGTAPKETPALEVIIRRLEALQETLDFCEEQVICFTNRVLGAVPPNAAAKSNEDISAGNAISKLHLGIDKLQSTTAGLADAVNRLRQIG